MSWNVEHNPALEYIECIFRDSTTSRDLQESTSKCISLGKKTGMNRFLVDTTGMNFEASIADLFFLPEEQYLNEHADKSSRIAVIYALFCGTRTREAVLFYETVCKNRRWNVRVFSERQQAIDWLLENV